MMHELTQLTETQPLNGSVRSLFTSLPLLEFKEQCVSGGNKTAIL